MKINSSDVRPAASGLLGGGGRSGLRWLVVLLAAAGAALAFFATDAPAAAPRPVAPVFEELGGHRHLITTRSQEAQRYFDQGLMLLYNFNHKEAIRSFRAAATLDPQSAMAHWGEAFAHGPHINAPMADDAVAPAWAALQEAIKRRPQASARERAR